MLAFVCLLWRLFHGTLGVPVPHQVWLEEAKPMQAEEAGASRPSFYRLPVFLHAPGPLVPPELFQPVPHKTALPVGLSALLIPPTTQHQSVQDGGSRAVEVWCGMDTITVRVDRFQLRAWSVPSRFRLGSCEANRVTSRYLDFHYGLMECGGELKVVGGQLVYTHLMSYASPPQDYVIRVFPLNLPIHCHYNRFHYSYQVGFRPQIQQTTLLKSLRSKLTFSLTVCNGQWEPLPPGHSFFLGEPVYFVAQASTLLAGERLFVDSCYATNSEDPNSSPTVDIISNYGCMTDSQREGSSSQFLSGGGSVLKFSMDAFLFRGVSQVQYLHCSLSIGLDVSHITKSCSYNKAFGRWEELAASSSVCSCCNSVCADTEGSFENRVRSVGWLVGQKEKAKPRMADMSFQAEEERKLDQEEKGKERMDVHYKDIWTKIDSEEEMGGALTDKKQWKVATGSRQRTSEKQGSESEEVLEEAASQLKDQPPDNIMSDESRRRKKESAQANDKVPYFRNDFVTVLSSDDGKDGSSTTAALRNSPFSLEYNATGDHSKAVNPIIPICPTSANISCSSNNGTVHQERGSDSGHGLVYSAVGVENFSPQNDTIPSGVRDKGKRNATNNSETDIRISPQVRMLGKGGIGPNTFDSILLLEQIKCVHKTVNPMSHTIPVGAANSANSEGSDGDGNLQSRGLESDQSAHSAGLTDLICEVGESDFDTGKEGGFLHLNRFAGEVKGQPEIAGGIPPRHSVGSLSVPSEQVKPSHSAVVTVTNTLHDSESNQMTDKLWPEVLPEWGLRSLGFVVKQPTEVEQELGRRLFFSRLDRLSPK